MTAVDVVCTWIGRVWALSALALVGLVVAAAVGDALRKRADVRLARQLGHAMWLEQPHADCARLRGEARDRLRGVCEAEFERRRRDEIDQLEDLAALPTYNPEGQQR